MRSGKDGRGTSCTGTDWLVMAGEAGWVADWLSKAAAGYAKVRQAGLGQVSSG